MPFAWIIELYFVKIIDKSFLGKADIRRTVLQ